MRRSTLSTIWVRSPVGSVVSGETQNTYIKPREICNANIQTDFSELEAAEYGNRINEMVRLRFDKVPDISKGDHIYMSAPSDDAQKGDYEVIAIKTGYSDIRLVRNPTIIDVRKVTK